MTKIKNYLVPVRYQHLRPMRNPVQSYPVARIYLAQDLASISPPETSRQLLFMVKFVEFWSRLHCTDVIRVEEMSLLVHATLNH